MRVTITAALVSLVLGLCIGGVIGWKLQAGRTANDRAAQAQATLTDWTQDITAQINKHQRQLMDQQQRSLALVLLDARIGEQAQTISEAIDNATFDDAPVSGGCTDVLGSSDFKRLYDRAATLGQATDVAGGATGSGVHYYGLEDSGSGADDATGRLGDLHATSQGDNADQAQTGRRPAVSGSAQ